MTRPLLKYPFQEKAFVKNQMCHFKFRSEEVNFKLASESWINFVRITVCVFFEAKHYFVSFLKSFHWIHNKTGFLKKELGPITSWFIQLFSLQSMTILFGKVSSVTFFCLNITVGDNVSSVHAQPWSFFFFFIPSRYHWNRFYFDKIGMSKGTVTSDRFNSDFSIFPFTKLKRSFLFYSIIVISDLLLSIFSSSVSFV